jgi:hypothetical protein
VKKGTPILDQDACTSTGPGTPLAAASTGAAEELDQHHHVPDSMATCSRGGQQGRSDRDGLLVYPEPDSERGCGGQSRGVKEQVPHRLERSGGGLILYSDPYPTLSARFFMIGRSFSPGHLDSPSSYHAFFGLGHARKHSAWTATMDLARSCSSLPFSLSILCSDLALEVSVYLFLCRIYVISA